MYVSCPCGSQHWGRFGAAGLLLTDPGRSGVLLQHRSRRVHQGGTWGVPGGALEPRETPTAAALREAREEAGIAAEDVTVLQTLIGSDHARWRYWYVLATADRPTDPVLRFRSLEAEETRWVDLAEVPALPLHPALRAAWPRLQTLLTAEGD